MSLGNSPEKPTAKTRPNPGMESKIEPLRVSLTYSRRITYIYVSALLAIAALAVYSHFLVANVVTREATAANTINMAGRVRMYSQVIAKVSLELATHANLRPQAEVRAGLQRGIEKMEADHYTLLHGDAAKGIAVPTPEMMKLYRGTPYNLDNEMTSFLDHAKHFLATPDAQCTTTNPDFVALEAAARKPMIDALDAVVAGYESESNDAITRIHVILNNVLIIILLTLLLEAIFIFRPLFSRLHRMHRSAVLAAMTDPLTGCLNRRAFSEAATREFARAKRYSQPFALVMIDMDNFKMINDRYGHVAGDETIIRMVQVLLAESRKSETLGRVGGDEFAMLLPQTTEQQAVSIARRLLSVINTVRIDGYGEPIHLSVSIGIAEFHPDDTGFYDVYNRADKAMYRAKTNGRNTVESGELQPQ